jgi:hypothetical protein
MQLPVPEATQHIALSLKVSQGHRAGDDLTA